MKDIISDQRRNERLQQRFAKRLERKMDELELVLRKWVDMVAATIPAFRQFNTDSPVIWYYRHRGERPGVCRDAARP